MMKRVVSMAQVALAQMFMLLPHLLLSTYLMPTAFGKNAARPWVHVHLGLYIFSAWAHLAASFWDPGFLPKGSMPDEHETRPPDTQSKAMDVCKRCRSVKPSRAHHCRICDRCVERMDHHCGCIGNCVGQRNMKPFLLFHMYVSVYCICSLAAAVVCAVICRIKGRPPPEILAFSTSPPVWDTTYCDAGMAHSILSLAISIEAVLFFLFIRTSFWYLWGHVIDSRSEIDFLKGAPKGDPKSCVEALREVMGEPRSWRWFLPLQTSKRSGKVAA